jgi:predicted transcriptional regulator
MSVESSSSSAVAEPTVVLDFFKALADETRLRLVGLLLAAEYTVDDLALRLELRPPTVSHHLNRLKALDLVTMRAEGTSHVYRLNTETLRTLARQALSLDTLSAVAVQPVARVAGEGDPFERKVLRDFVRGDTLKEIPASRKKRDVILRWLVERFDSGRRYSEAEVNAVLARHHADVATLRRELIGAGLMQRANNQYWRL